MSITVHHNYNSTKKEHYLTLKWTEGCFANAIQLHGYNLNVASLIRELDKHKEKQHNPILFQYLLRLLIANGFVEEYWEE